MSSWKYRPFRTGDFFDIWRPGAGLAWCSTSAYDDAGARAGTPRHASPSWSHQYRTEVATDAALIFAAFDCPCSSKAVLARWAVRASAMKAVLMGGAP
jgi:hypothetical protein